MQIKIEIEYKSKHYIVKADDEMRFSDVLKVMGISETDYRLLVTTKNRYVQAFNKLKDLNIVTNDIIKVLVENDEKTI